MKAWLAVLWVVLCAVLFAACSGSSGPAGGGAGTSGTAAEPTAVFTAGATPTRQPTRTATPAHAVPTIPTAVPVEERRVTWLGKPWYLHGANLPWFNWGCDFGCGPKGGVSDPDVAAGVGPVLKNAGANGLNVVRWWMFPGEPTQFQRDANGGPTGLKPEVFADLDAALQLAQAHDLYYVMVLFSAPTDIPGEWLTDTSQRAALASVLGDLAARYKGNPRLMAWDVFNEPEWDIWSGAVSQQDVVATVNAVTDRLHASSQALVTIGSASIEGLGIWANSRLDFYSPHWYDPMAGLDCAPCTSYPVLRWAYGLRKPVVIGEFYADALVDARQRYAGFYEKGYAGAFAWSLLPDRTEDRLGIDLRAASEFAATHTDAGPR